MFEADDTKNVLWKCILSKMVGGFLLKDKEEEVAAATAVVVVVVLCLHYIKYKRQCSRFKLHYIKLTIYLIVCCVTKQC